MTQGSQKCAILGVGIIDVLSHVPLTSIDNLSNLHPSNLIQGCSSKTAKGYSFARDKEFATDSEILVLVNHLRNTKMESLKDSLGNTRPKDVTSMGSRSFLLARLYVLLPKSALGYKGIVTSGRTYIDWMKGQDALTPDESTFSFRENFMRGVKSYMATYGNVANACRYDINYKDVKLTCSQCDSPISPTLEFTSPLITGSH